MAQLLRGDRGVDVVRRGLGSAREVALGQVTSDGAGVALL